MVQSLQSVRMDKEDFIRVGGFSQNTSFSSVQFSSVQFSSVTQPCPTLCDPVNRSTPGLLVHHLLPEFTQTHIH